MNKIEIDGEMMTPVIGKYENGRTAVSLVDASGAPYCHVTVNVPEWDGEPGEVLVKTWSENEEIFGRLVHRGYVVPTGRFVRCGFSRAAVCVLGPELRG